MSIDTLSPVPAQPKVAPVRGTQPYRHTAAVLRVAAVLFFAAGVLRVSAAECAIAVAYWMAATNPWRYRIVVNLALVFHVLAAVVAGVGLLSEYGDALFFGMHLVAFAAFAWFYPSPYPIWMNLFSRFTGPDAGVDWMENYPRLLRWSSAGTLVGTVQGLYANDDAFDFAQDPGFLGFSPPARILAAARQAGVTDGVTILDVGSGQGGPACVLAAEFRVQVHGIDLLANNVERANRSAAMRFLTERVHFEQGDALSMRYPDASFDFIFGSDAWCHIPSRDRLLEECHRLLKPGGVMFFFDWIDRGGLSETFRFVYSFPPLETPESYREKLEAAGFHVRAVEVDRQEDFAAHVQGIERRIEDSRSEMIEVCGREVYDNWQVVMRYTQRMIQNGSLGHAFFIADKR